MTLDDWLGFASTLHPVEIDLGLTRILEVASRLGLLKPSYPIITVAGTNGKGSTVAFLESIYHDAGYTTCATSSPHIYRFNERLRANGKAIDDASLCRAFEKVKAALGDTTLTYFEFTHLGCMQVIDDIQPDVALLEVGLGGRLDATNIVTPSCAVITTIALDHQDKLGDTREKIGREKAGIMRNGIPFVCGDYDPPESVKTLAHKHGCKTFYAKPNDTPTMPLKLPKQNAGTAVLTVKAMQNVLPVKDASIERGLMNATLPGRFEIIEGDVTHILDVAHNPQSATLLADNLKTLTTNGKRIAVFSMLRDKDIPGTIEPMLSLVDEWFIAQIHNIPRAASMSELVNAFPKNTHITHCDSLDEAKRRAREAASHDDTILVFGSFYTLAQANLFS